MMLTRALHPLRRAVRRFSAATATPVLVQCTELEALIAAHAASKKRLVIVDCSPPSDNHVYLPGAVSLHEAAQHAGTWVALKAPDRVNVVTREQFLRVLGALGVTPTTSIVAYDSAQSQLAARFLWASSLYGLADGQVRVLDGGLKNWCAHELNTSVEPEDAEPAAAAGGADAWPAARTAELLATLSDVQTALKDKSATLFDLRSAGEYAGLKRLCKRGGHIPGARHVDWSLLVDEKTHCLLPAKQLHDKLVRAGVLPLIAPPPGRERPIVTYCQAGGRAAVGYLALRSLGFTKARMYDASMAEWANRDDTPLE